MANIGRMNSTAIPADVVSALADDVLRAAASAQPLGWGRDTPKDLDEAYATALAVREAHVRRGHKPVGYKVGFTNRTIWPIYSVYAPIWGTVWQHTLTRLDVSEGVIDLTGLCEARIEPEIVFGFRNPPPADCGLQGLIDAVGWIAHGFEIVHTHFPGWKFTAAQAVADSGLHGHLLVGPAVAVAAGTQAQPLAEALAGLQLALYGNGQLRDRGRGGNVLDGPLQALLYFVRALRATPGAPELRSGDIVTTGTLTDAQPVRAGESWHSVIEMADRAAGAFTIEGLKVRFTG